jgi:sulfur carrier protein
MRLTINEELFDGLFDAANAATISELLKELKIEPGRVAVEVNLRIVKKVDYPTFRLNDGDKIEIVNFVGGG